MSETWVVVWVRAGRVRFAASGPDWVGGWADEEVLRFPTREAAEEFRVAYTWEDRTFVERARE